jgi:hypothetical protein
VGIEYAGRVLMIRRTCDGGITGMGIHIWTTIESTYGEEGTDSLKDARLQCILQPVLIRMYLVCRATE